MNVTELRLCIAHDKIDVLIDMTKFLNDRKVPFKILVYSADQNRSTETKTQNGDWVNRKEQGEKVKNTEIAVVAEQNKHNARKDSTIQKLQMKGGKVDLNASVLAWSPDKTKKAQMNSTINESWKEEEDWEKEIPVTGNVFGYSQKQKNGVFQSNDTGFSKKNDFSSSSQSSQLSFSSSFTSSATGSIHLDNTYGKTPTPFSRRFVNGNSGFQSNFGSQSGVNSTARFQKFSKFVTQ